MAEQIRVRVCFSAGEVEIGGEADRVREWWDLLEADVSEFRKRFTGGAIPPSPASPSVTSPERPTRGNTLAVAATFGEFVHQFPPNVTDIERALIAGLFIQSGDANNNFTTGGVNELLLQQGVRLTNASASIRRNVDARRAIMLGSGQFRVSQAGIEYLARLQARPT
jgi:hypothetical protein